MLEIKRLPQSVGSGRRYRYMVVFLTYLRGPQYRPRTTITPMIATPQKGAPNFVKASYGHFGKRSSVTKISRICFGFIVPLK